MKLTVILLTLYVTQVFAMGARRPVPAPEPTPVETPAPEVVVARPELPYLTVTRCTNCQADEWKRIQDATVKVNEVVRGQCFREKLQSMPLIQTLGRSPAQVVDSLVGADIKIEAEMYWTAKRVLGYTMDGYNKEWLNRRYMMAWNTSIRKTMAK